MIDNLNSSSPDAIPFFMKWLQHSFDVIVNYPNFSTEIVESNLLTIGAICSSLKPAHRDYDLFFNAISQLIPKIMEIVKNCTDPFVKSISAFVFRCYTKESCDTKLMDPIIETLLEALKPEVKRKIVTSNDF